MSPQPAAKVGKVEGGLWRPGQRGAGAGRWHWALNAVGRDGWDTPCHPTFRAPPLDY